MQRDDLFFRYPPVYTPPSIEQTDSFDPNDSQLTIGKQIFTPDAVYTYTGSKWVSVSSPSAKNHLIAMRADKPGRVTIGAATTLNRQPVTFGVPMPFPKESSTGYLVLFSNGDLIYNTAADFDHLSSSDTTILSCEYEIGSSKATIHFVITKPANVTILKLLDDRLSELTKTASNLAEFQLDEFDSKKARCIALNSFDGRVYYVNEDKAGWQLCYISGEAPFITSDKFALNPLAKFSCASINHGDYTALFILTGSRTEGFKGFGQLATMPGYLQTIPTINAPGKVLEVKCDLADKPFSIAWSPITGTWYGILSDTRLVEYSLTYVGPHMQATATTYTLADAPSSLATSALISDASGAIYAIGDSLCVIDVVGLTVKTLVDKVDSPSISAATSNPLTMSTLATPELRVAPYCTTKVNQFVQISSLATIITPLTESIPTISRLIIELSQPGVMSIAVPEGIIEVVEPLRYTYYGDSDVSNYQSILSTACYASPLVMDDEHLITVTVEALNGLSATAKIRVFVIQ